MANNIQGTAIKQSTGSKIFDVVNILILFVLCMN